MYCDNCGQKLESSDKFCTKCGTRNGSEDKARTAPVAGNDKWWFRLMKVAYILLYVPLPLILWGVWEINATSWSYYGGSQDTSGQAFWYCLITLAVYFAVVRLIKIACLYVAAGQKPNWKREFKRLF